MASVVLLACLFSFKERKRLHSKYIQSSHTKSIYKVHINKVHTKSVAYTTYPPHLHKFFSMCLRFTKSNRGISCTGWTTNVVCTVYVLDTVRITCPIIWMRIFRIHSCRIATIDIWMVIWVTNVIIFLNHWNLSGKYLSISFPPNNDCWPLHLGHSKQIICPIVCQFFLRTCMLD